MSDTIMLLLAVAGGGFCVGALFGGWAEASRWRSKGPDSVGWRTAMCSGGKFYYVVTEREYVNRIMGPAQ